MEQLKKNMIYINKPCITKKWLLSHHFYPNKSFCDIYEDTIIDTYSIQFSICNHTLECELTAIPKHKYMYIDVYRYGTNDIYSPFYYYKYGDYEKILNIICEDVNKKLKQLGLKTQFSF